MNFNSNMNAVIRAVLNSLFFFTKRFRTHRKTQRHKDTQAKAQNANKQISDFFSLHAFKSFSFLFFFAVSVLCFLCLWNFWIKKSKIDLITSFPLLPACWIDCFWIFWTTCRGNYRQGWWKWRWRIRWTNCRCLKKWSWRDNQNFEQINSVYREFKFDRLISKPTRIINQLRHKWGNLQ